MIRQGDIVTLVPEKPAAGGRMLARHEGMVVLVAGAIPGEPVRVRIDRVERSLAFGYAVDVVEPHASRRPVEGDPRCGGAVLAHIVYEEQCRLKGEIISDALARVGRIPVERPIGVVPSPETGYRMRARLHLRGGRIGFFLEGTHQLCDAGLTRQLLPDAVRAARELADRLAAAGFAEDADVELSENRAGDQRAMHVELSRAGARGPVPSVEPVHAVTGLSWRTAGGGRPVDIYGLPYVEDVVRGVRLRRHARAFFQGNRYLLDALVSAVIDACEPGPVVDLYAGVGLLGLCRGGERPARRGGRGGPRRDRGGPRGECASAGCGGPRRADQRRAVRRPPPPARPCTLVLDPPRSGMTRDAVAGAIALRAVRVVFVSCDVATLARDLRRFLDAGYSLDSVQGFDLFPNTAHVEALARLSLR